MMDSTKVQINKLNDDNYQIWRYKLELLLIKEDLWSVITEQPPVDAVQLAAWNKKDGKARAHIGLFIEDNQIIHVRNKTTAKAMWESLHEYHQKSTLSNKVRLLRRLCRMRLPEGGNMQSHLNEMDECIEELTALGENLAESFAVSLYLSSLSESYSVLITALESRAEADLTKNMVKNKLLEEYRRRQDIVGTNGSEGQALSVERKNTNFEKSMATCFFCKKKGHIKNDCRKYAAWKKKKENTGTNSRNQANIVQNNSDTEESVCFMVNHQVNISEWCVDSGASAHMSCNEAFFKHLVKSTNDSVTLADGSNLQICGTGIIDFKDKVTNFTLNEVQFVPGLKCNLLSVSKLAKNGCNVTFKGQNCEISKNGKILLVVKSKNDVYKLNQQHKALNTILSIKSKCVHEWHKVLGHRNLVDVKKMAEYAVNMKINNCNHSDMCEVCIQCKKTRDPFPQQSFTKSTGNLDLVHTDVCGPIQIATPRGNKYILTIIDDHSRYCYIYLMKQKSKVCDKVKEFVESMKTQYGKVPKVIRSDRGGEYLDNELRNYLKLKGIRTQFTVPNTPQQNGVAERKNRTLIEMTRCMLTSSGLHKQYWGEAVSTANHIINRLPTDSIKSTPYELWHGKFPDLSYMNIFGTPVYAHIPKNQRKKLDDTAEKLIFVGYETGTKGFRLLDVNTHKIKICRDVKFIGSNAETNNESTIDVPSYSQNEYELEESTQLIEDNTPDIVPEGENLRRSMRTNKGVPPRRLIMEVNKVTKEINTDPVTYEEAINCSNSQNWITAMKQEMDSLNNFGTWEITKLPLGETAIGCKWVYKTKTDQEGNIVKFKARLVAQGFSQKYGRDYEEVFAPVANPTTLKILLAIAGKRKMVVKHFDIEAAYLNGELSHNVYMKQPKGFTIGDSNQVCKLIKNLYGLKQGAKEWNKKFDTIMKKNGYIQSENDLCLYKKKIKQHVIYISNHVDDIVAASTDIGLINVFEKSMNEYLTIKNLGNLQFYLGIQFTRDNNGIFYLNQEKYIMNKLQEFNLSDAKESSIPINAGYLNQTMNQDPFQSQEVYRSAIGSLLYLSTNTRPDISIATSILARKVSNPKQCDWNEVKRVYRYLKATKSLKLKLGDEENDPNLKCFVDADWAGDQLDRKSTSGYCFIFNGALISWISRKQTSVSLSSTEAEFIAFAEAVRDLIWVERILNDLDERVEIPISIFEDNQGCIKLLNDRIIHQRVKHIDIKYKFVHNHITSKKITAIYCSTDNMIADMLTKPLNGPKLAKHAKTMGLM